MIAQAFHFAKRVNQERPFVGTTENYTTAYNWNGYLAKDTLLKTVRLSFKGPLIQHPLFLSL